MAEPPKKVWKHGRDHYRAIPDSTHVDPETIQAWQRQFHEKDPDTHDRKVIRLASFERANPAHAHEFVGGAGIITHTYFVRSITPANDEFRLIRESRTETPDPAAHGGKIPGFGTTMNLRVTQDGRIIEGH